MGIAKILLIEDDESYVQSFRLMMRGHPVEVVWMPNGVQGIQAYRKNTLSYSTVVIDYKLPDLLGSEVAQQIRKTNPTQDILFASGYSETDYLTDMLTSGLARSFISKGKSIEQAREIVLTSIRLYENKHRIIGADDHQPDKTERDAAQHGFVGRSPATKDLIEQINRVRLLPVDVRIIGETGTGKEIAAKSLVPDGMRMVEVACPEFNSSENAFESDLFGHVKGSFTGAESEKPGLLLQAHKNVLFLDEVHTLSITNQQKFLRVLQERKFRRKGDEKGHQIPVEFRLISAAKPEIHAMVKDGRFLEDLYHRLGMVDIFIPPLRDRAEDIEPLVRHFQDKFNRTTMPPNQQKQFRISTIREMEKHRWSANVRELGSAVCSMMLKVRSDIVNPSDFDDYLRAKAVQSGEFISPLQGRPAAEKVDQLMRNEVITALKASRTQVEASEKLGMNRSKLIRQIKRLRIDADAYLLQTETIKGE